LVFKYYRYCPMASNQSEPPGNKYTLLDLIGTGGMAEVFRGKLSGAEGFEKLVVLKKLLAQYSRDPEIVAHFISEAKLAALLQHENIAQIYDFGQLDGSYFIAMEYLLGRDLQSVMQRARELQEPLGAERALYITAKVCEAMEYAHTLRDFQQQPLHIVHRDLSPHNIFITFDGRVKIIDFGIARAEMFDNKTQIGVAKGKIAYMSPEQLAAEKIDHRSDIFAVGILLYEMLSGKRMYAGDTATMIRKCMQVEYDKLQTVCPGLPPAVYDILDKALEKDVGRRYQTCAHMQAEVEEALFAINRRPSPQLLEKYIGRLFAREVAAEKDGLSRSDTGKNDAGIRTASAATTSQGTTGQHPAPAREDLPGATGPAPPAEDATQVAGIGMENLSPRRSHAMKRVLTASICVALLVIFALFWQLTGDWEQGAPDMRHGQLTAARHEEQQQPHPAEESAASSVPGKITASHHVSKGMFLPPKDGRFSLLQESFEGQKQKKIANLLEKAEKAVHNNHLTTPAGDNAHAYYLEILDLDRQNAAALEGIERLADGYASLAETAFRRMEIPIAREHVQQGLAISPQHRRLLQLHRDLSRSRPGIFFKSVEKSVRLLFQ
jgi:serine/threonine protein kinase